MNKQVKTVPAATEAPANQNKYICIYTFENKTGKTIGERIVDLFHYGTRNWIQQHIWWAMHNGHEIEVKPATDDQISAYIKAGVEALAEKVNHKPLPVTQAA